LHTQLQFALAAQQLLALVEMVGRHLLILFQSSVAALVGGLMSLLV
jgi:hypothetical protein